MASQIVSRRCGVVCYDRGHGIKCSELVETSGGEASLVRVRRGVHG